MSELEKRIQALSLRAPQNSLDERILATLGQNDALPSAESSRQEKAVASEAAGFSPAVPSNRRGSVVTSGWIVASVSMLIGTIVGNSLPSFNAFDVKQAASLNANKMPGKATSARLELPNGSPLVAEPGQSNGIAEGNFVDSSRSVASQIVESIWISPAAAAVAWEQQSGQIFNVVNHVNDRRFDMCRDCHRVGG